MSQISYSQDFPVAFAGLKADAGFDRIESFAAEGAVGFGLGVVNGESADQVKIPIQNKSILSIDADLIASNSTIVTVNGNATTATVYATSHEATMAAIAAKVAVLTGVASATYSGTGRDITIIGENGIEIDASAVTTLGASQGTWTQAQSSNDTVRGISIHQHVEKQADGTAEYLDEEAVGVMRQGLVWMRQETSDIGTLAVDDDVYINVAIAGVQRGRVTSVSAGNLQIPTGKCRELSVDPDGNAIVKVEINTP